MNNILSILLYLISEFELSRLVFFSFLYLKKKYKLLCLTIACKQKYNNSIEILLHLMLKYASKDAKMTFFSNYNKQSTRKIINNQQENLQNN